MCETCDFGLCCWVFHTVSRCVFVSKFGLNTTTITTTTTSTTITTTATNANYYNN